MSQKWDSLTWSPGSDGHHLLGRPSSTRDCHCRGAQTSKREKKWGGKRVSKETRQGRRRDQKNRATDEMNRVREKKEDGGGEEDSKKKTNQHMHATALTNCGGAPALLRSCSHLGHMTTGFGLRALVIIIGTLIAFLLTHSIIARLYSVPSDVRSHSMLFYS